MDEKPQAGVTTTPLGRYGPWLAVAAVVLFIVVVRYRMLGVPLERDEGEYAYHAQLLLDGVPPYAGAYSLKFPGIVLIYAGIIAIGGATGEAIRCGALIANVAAIVLMYGLGSRVAGRTAGVAACACFTLMSISTAVDGPYANTEVFLIVPMIGAFLLLLDTRPRSLVIAGFLLGLAIVIKQHAAVFLVGGAVLLWLQPQGPRGRWRRIGLLMIGPAVCLMTLCVWLLAAGVFDRFWFFTVEYVTRYVSQAPLMGAVGRWLRLFTSMWALWVLVLIGLAGMNRLKGRRAFIAVFFIASLMATVPGLHFWRHYFILLLPAAALLGGIGVTVIARFKPGAAVVAGLVCIAVTLVPWRGYLLAASPDRISRIVHGMNPFPETRVIGQFVAKRSGPDDEIAVIGSEPQIYFYAQRRSATPHMYTYPMMENHALARQMQEEMIRDIELAAPRFIVLMRVDNSWLQRPGADLSIYSWANDYSRRYEAIMLVELYMDRGISEIWAGKTVRSRKPATEQWIRVMVRREPPGAGAAP